MRIRLRVRLLPGVTASYQLPSRAQRHARRDARRARNRAEQMRWARAILKIATGDRS